MTREEIKGRVRIDASTGCWNWIGYYLAGQGYGLIKIGNVQTRAHRHSYEVFKGAIQKGAIICHTCDNPKCVNPEHLYAGTPLDNMRDKIRRGRSPTIRVFGERSGSSKYSDATVMELRAYRASHPTICWRLIAQKFGMSETNAYTICAGKSRTHGSSVSIARKALGEKP